MVPEFASNVAHCDNILVALIRLRPRVKLSTRHDAHLLCSNHCRTSVMWHVRTLDALAGADFVQIRMIQAPAIAELIKCAYSSVSTNSILEVGEPGDSAGNGTTTREILEVDPTLRAWLSYMRCRMATTRLPLVHVGM